MSTEVCARQNIISGSRECGSSEKNTPRKPVRSINRPRCSGRSGTQIRSSRLGATDIAAIAAAVASASDLKIPYACVCMCIENEYRRNYVVLIIASINIRWPVWRRYPALIIAVKRFSDPR